MSGSAPIEHPLPRVATVKRMYGTAFRCGHPQCRRPLYRLNDVNGELTLNSTVAHIHARRENGPRWNDAMTAEENRAEPNLVLLCLEHSSEVDDLPGAYPAEEMRAWKDAVRLEFDRFHDNWDLNDDQVAEIFAASFDVRRFAQTAVESVSLTQSVRLGTRIIEHSVSARRPARQVAAAWVRLCDRHNSQAPMYDDDGERVRFSPPEIERRQYAEHMQNALSGAAAVLEPMVQELTSELRALEATNPELRAWCEWTRREAQSVLEAACTASLDAAPDADTSELSRAIDALSAKWRGEDAPTPPPPQPPVRQPGPDRLTVARAALLQVTEPAQPWGRVTTRPYDADLYDALVAALPLTLLVPPTVSNSSIRLDNVARLAAAVARNAEERTYEDRVEQAHQLEGEAPSIALLTALLAVAAAGSRDRLAARAEQLRGQRLQALTWSEASTWESNLVYCKTLLTLTAESTSDDSVRDSLTPVIALLPVDTTLLALSSWRETFPSLDFSAPGRPQPYIGALPDWAPAATLRAVVLDTYPDLVEADLDGRDTRRRLAAELAKETGGFETAP